MMNSQKSLFTLARLGRASAETSIHTNENENVHRNNSRVYFPGALRIPAIVLNHDYYLFNKPMCNRVNVSIERTTTHTHPPPPNYRS